MLMDTTDASDQPLLDALQKASQGDGSAWQEIVGLVHGRLRRMVDLRLDHRLRGRIDPSDVLQESYLNAFEDLPEFLKSRSTEMPFFLWLRFLVGDRISKLHRYHLGTQQRDVRREVPLFHLAMQPEASSIAMALQLVGNDAQPALEAEKAERRRKVQAALEQLDPLEREVLALRHFEQLNSAEAAQVLGVSAPAARQRYLRALAKLQGMLDGWRLQAQQHDEGA